MRQPNWSEEEQRRNPARLFILLLLSAFIHCYLFALFETSRPEPTKIDTQSISVALITLPPPKVPQMPANASDNPPPIKPNPAPKAVPKPPQISRIAPPVPTPQPVPDIPPPTGQSSPPVQAAPTPKGEILISDRWRLPVGARISLDQIGPAQGSLGAVLDCLKGFETDCAEQRKFVFAEDQLSETDLVWMASHPHSGLSDSSLFGMSETEIRKRLGIPAAGENGFMILPGIGIDGPLWDKLHGVNKACKYSVGIGDGGQRELRKRCDDDGP